MRARSRLLAALAAVPLVLLVAPSAPARAHGTMTDPPSRAYVCFQENPESPTSAACRAAVAAAGTQAFYDWNEVSLLDAGGRHRQIIPDGKLCSAGREKFRGLDLPRADWPARRVSAGDVSLGFRLTAPHAGSNFEFYLTRAGYDPAQPLRWSDLVPLRTFTGQNPTGSSRWPVTLPQRTGRHILYTIWQRVQGSQEAFYMCSDVDFGGANSPSPGPSVSPTPTPTGTSSPPPAGGSTTWRLYDSYRVGQTVTFAGRTYRCRQAHTAYPGWEPPHVLALWLPV